MLAEHRALVAGSPIDRIVPRRAGDSTTVDGSTGMSARVEGMLGPAPAAFKRHRW
jgi:hypothetical protein